MFPRQQITVTHNGTDILFEDKTLTTDVFLRENKGSNATLTAVDTDAFVYLNEIDQDDVIQISMKNDVGESFSQVFGGYVVELAPEGTATGLNLPTKCYGFDIALDRMRAAIEYGTESTHPTLDTLLEIMTDSSYGLIPKWTQKVLATSVDSGYTFNTDNILDDATSHVYLPYPYTPINDCLKTILDLTAAANYPDPGLHWLVIPDGTTPYLCIDQIGNHTTAAAKWPTVCLIELTPGQNIMSTTFYKQQMEANYIVYFGKYEYPTGEIITENAAAYWTNYSNPASSVTDDSTDFKVGENCVHWDFGVAGATSSVYYFPLANLNISKIGTKRSVPTFSCYVKTKNMAWVDIILGTGTVMSHYYRRRLSLPSNDKWGVSELSLGEYIKAGDENAWTIDAGSPDWNNLTYMGIIAERPGAGQSDLRLDNILFNGIVTRGAYQTGADYYKVKLITDSLAKTTNLVASDDSGTVGQLAKADLIRSMTKPIVGKIKLNNIYPTILPGQITTSNLRITEVHHHLDSKEAYTELDFTDDLLNSYPAENTSFGPTAQYNAMMKAVNPDFQDRDRGNLKAREIDIDQPILAKGY